MADKRQRNPYENRYEKGEDEDSSETEKDSKDSKTEKTPLRERTNINMYIEDESLVDDLQLQYKKLDLEWSEKHGEDLPKNDCFYPAVLQAALNGTSIRDELGL